MPYAGKNKNVIIVKDKQIRSIFIPTALESFVVVCVVFGGSVGCKLDTVDTVGAVDAVDDVSTPAENPISFFRGAVESPPQLTLNR